MYDGSVKEVHLASGDSVLKDSPWKEQDAEGLASTSEVVEVFGDEKPLEVENIAATIEDIGVVKLEPTSEASIVVSPQSFFSSKVGPTKNDNNSVDAPF